ncbi:MAG: hypothetical protein FWG31_09125 [Oscillospiraceae bacterium]|nr:hypothetical protein [Oscillospiraceae bacterium]
MKKSKTLLWFAVPLVVIPILLVILSFISSSYALNNPIVFSIKEYVSFFKIPALREVFWASFPSVFTAPIALCGLLCAALFVGKALLYRFRGVAVKNGIFFSVTFTILTAIVYISLYSDMNNLFGSPYSYSSLFLVHLGDIKPILFNVPFFLIAAWISVSISLLVWLGAQAGKAVWNKMRRKSV